MSNACINLMPGAWRVEVVETRRRTVWVLADTPEAARQAAVVQAATLDTITIQVTDVRAPTIQEAGEWLGIIGRLGAPDSRRPSCS